MEQTYLDYLSLLKDLGGIFDQLSALAQDKALSVRSGNFADLAQIINREQAISLSLRSLEQKRLKMLEEMELVGIPLSDLPRHYPRKLQAQAEQAVEAVKPVPRLPWLCGDCPQYAGVQPLGNRKNC